MPQLAANLTMLFTERPFPERFAAAARAGFKGVEFLFPYAWPKAHLADALAGAGLTQVLFNLPPGDWEGGERGIACHPDRVGEFRDSVGQAIDYARALGCTRLHAMAGLTPSTADADAVLDCYVDNLRFAADALVAEGMQLLIEPISDRAMPGYYLNHSAQAEAVLERVGATNAFIQYDIYHAQRSEGELAATIERLLPRIGHMQLADNPGRHEPGSGEINYPWLLAHIDALGYTGWIGCEYNPAAGTEAGLGWAAGYL